MWIFIPLPLAISIDLVTAKISAIGLILLEINSGQLILKFYTEKRKFLDGADFGS